MVFWILVRSLKYNFIPDTFGISIICNAVHSAVGRVGVFVNRQARGLSHTEEYRRLFFRHCVAGFVRPYNTCSDEHNLKTRIHNNIGASLIAISEIMNNTKDGDMEQQLRLLQDAVGYFSDDRTVCDNTFDELRQKAAVAEDIQGRKPYRRGKGRICPLPAV